jgi:hypothetical protein
MGITKKKKRPTKKKGTSLYADYHPKTSVKGFGYKDSQTARKTLKKLKKMKVNRTYWFQVVNTMYNRAKYHKNQTNEMKNAMKIFNKAIKRMKQN